MDVLKALKVIRDGLSPQELFIGAIEYLNIYREGNFVVHYCSILSEYVYIELYGLELFYLDFLSVV